MLEVSHSVLFRDAPVGADGALAVASGPEVVGDHKQWCRALAAEMLAARVPLLPETWWLSKEFGVAALRGDVREWTSRLEAEPKTAERLETALRSAIAAATPAAEARSAGARRAAAMLDATAWLRAREAAWSARLRGVSLVGELDLSAEESAALLDNLGVWWREVGGSVDTLRRRYPACLTVALVAVAAKDYAHGTYWPALAEETNTPDLIRHQRALGQGFLAELAEFDLARFDHLSQPFMGPITAHAMIPTFCLKNVFMLFAECLQVQPGVSARALLRWLRADEANLRRLHKPAQVFLCDGGDYALDFTDRCLDMLSRPVIDEDPFEGVGLPDRVVSWYRTLVLDGLLDAPTAAVRTRKPPKVRLHLDPYDRGLCLALPVREGSEFDVDVWAVASPRRQWTVPVPRRPGGGVQLETLTRPDAQVHVSVDSGWLPAQTVEVLATAGDTLLVFDADGRLMVPEAPVPADAAWLVYPLAGREETAALIVDGVEWDRGLTEPAYGWETWSLHEVDLARSRSLRFGSSPVYAVGEPDAPRLVLPERVACVDAGGLPVYGTRPGLMLPGAHASWAVSITRAGEDLPWRVVRFEGPDGEVDPWPDGPVVGRFEVSVRGPLGRGLRRRVVTVAEGLTVKAEPEFRPMTGAGLVPAQVRIQIPDALSRRGRAASATVRLDESTETDTVQVGLGAGLLNLRVRVPHAWVQWQGDDSVSPRSITPFEWVAEEALANLGHLLVRVAETAGWARLEYRCGGAVVSEARAHQNTRSADLLRFSLHGQWDNITAHPVGEFVLSTDEVPLLRLLPTGLATDVIREEAGALWVVDATRADRLCADVYFTDYPWRGPVTCSVRVDGLVAVPEALADPVGGLLVALRRADALGAAGLPPWPDVDAKDVFEVLPVPSQERDGLRAVLAEEEAAFVAGLRSDGALPRTPQTVARLLGLLVADRWRHLPPRPAEDFTWPELVLGGLRMHRTRTLRALLAAEVTPELVTSTLASSGLVTEPLSALTSVDVERLWPRYPLAALLASSEGLRAADPGSLRLASRYCGTGWDRATGRKKIVSLLKVGAWGAEIDVLDQLPAETLAAERRRILDQFSRRAAPPLLLDDAPRAAASAQLFAHRHDPALAGLAADGLLEEIERVLDAARGGFFVSLTRDQSPARAGWRALPSLSFGLAAIARLSARDQRPARDAIGRLLPHLAALASVAPDQVTTDLLLAEALLIGAGR